MRKSRTIIYVRPAARRGEKDNAYGVLEDVLWNYDEQRG